MIDHIQKSKRIIQFVEPLASVILCQECNILIKAYVVHVFGMVPNSLSSILANLNVARPQTLPFDKTGVNEIGRKLSFMSV